LTLAQIANPATRRAVLWLVMEVIQVPRAPRPSQTLRLGYSAQDDFFGTMPHDGWEWLTTQARAWPMAYRSLYWPGFDADGDRLKGTNDIMAGTECH
jgi:hypothetical protein